MNKPRRSSVPVRFWRRKGERFFKRYFSLCRYTLTAGLFIVLFAAMIKQPEERRNNLNQSDAASQAMNVSFSYPVETANQYRPPASEVFDIEQEQDYLQTALQQEEPVEARYVLPEMIAREVSFPETAPAAELVAAAENNSLNEEKEYAAYEEELPHDIVDDFGLAEQAKDKGYAIHNNSRRVAEMKITPYRKPLWGSQPVIAIVIDDMGDNVRRTRDISSIKAPLTASFLTYPPHLSQQVERSLKAGHEIMLHVPMQPKSMANVSDDVLRVDMPPRQISDNFRAMLNKFSNVKGINNHMGSRFTEDRMAMAEIMKILSDRGLFFLDSKTTPASVGKSVAAEYGVDYANRHVFLDNKNERDYILHQLEVTADIARKNGYAIAIGHPKSQTFEALRQWLPTLDEKQLKLVHLSRIVAALN